MIRFHRQMTLTSHGTLLIKGDEDAAFPTHWSYVTGSIPADALQRQAGTSHSSARVARAGRDSWGQAATQAGSPDSHVAPS